MAKSKQNIVSRSRKERVDSLMHAGNLPDAKKLAEILIQKDRLDADLWVTLAVINRRLGSYREAETCARVALAARPNHAAAHVALGAALQCQGDVAAGIENYRRAVACEPDLVEAHYLLGNALRELGQLDEAVASYRRACALQPNFLAALSNLGAALTSQGRTEEAATWLNQALSLAPNSPQVLCNVGALLVLDSRFEEARARFQQALKINPVFVDALAALAEIEEKMSRIDEAKSIISRGLAIAPEDARLIIVSAKIARAEGRHQDAIGLLERVLAGRHDPLLRGEIKLTLGKLYDHIGEADRAFSLFCDGNRLVAEMLPRDFDRQGYLRELDRAEASWNPLLAEAAFQANDDNGDGSPVFLIGFPRSGTTLLDQILDAHPRLQTLSERPTVNALLEAVWKLAGKQPQAMLDFSPDDIARLRKVYFEAAGRFVQLDGKLQLIDKMPLNTSFAHVLWRVFPRSKFIMAIRHPCDVCLSCFMQNFLASQSMVLFQSLPDTVSLYTRVMSFWRQMTDALPLDRQQIRYEDLVADFEGEAHRLFNYLGVGWDDSILRYAEHAKGRTVNTASYYQVRQPIFRHASYRWKRYAKHLEPYLPTLAPFIEHFGYSETSPGATAPNDRNEAMRR